MVVVSEGNVLHGVKRREIVAGELCGEDMSRGAMSRSIADWRDV